MGNDLSLHELIEKYDFSELNQEQQQFVLLEMTKEEYAELRKTVALTVDYFENEPILMAEDLLAPKFKEESVFSKIINYQLPVYKIAAILVVVLCVDNLIPDEVSQEAQISEVYKETVPGVNLFSAYNKYTSNNSIKYNKGLARLYE